MSYIIIINTINFNFNLNEYIDIAYSYDEYKLPCT